MVALERRARRTRHASPRLWKPVPSALWSTDRHSPFVRDADRKFSFLWYGRNNRWGGGGKKGERRRKRNSNAGRNGKKRREKDLWQERRPPELDARSDRTRWGWKNKNRLETASYASSKRLENNNYTVLIDVVMRRWWTINIAWKQHLTLLRNKRKMATIYFYWPNHATKSKLR